MIPPSCVIYKNLIECEGGWGLPMESNMRRGLHTGPNTTGHLYLFIWVFLCVRMHAGARAICLNIAVLGVQTDANILAKNRHVSYVMAW